MNVSQIALENNHGSHFVDDFSALGATHIGGEQAFLGLGRGIPLIPSFDGNGETHCFKKLCERLAKSFNTFGRDAICSFLVERNAHNDPFHLVLTTEIKDCLMVAAIPTPGKDVQRLRRPAKGIAHGHADPPGPHIKAKNTHNVQDSGFTHSNQEHFW